MSGGSSTIVAPSASRATEPLSAANAGRPGSYGSVTTAPARSATRRTTVSWACDRSSKPCTCSGVPSQAVTSRASRAQASTRRRGASHAASSSSRAHQAAYSRAEVLAGRVARRRGRERGRDRRAPSRAGRTAGRAHRGTARRRPRRRSCRARTPAIRRASSSRRRAGGSAARSAPASRSARSNTPSNVTTRPPSSTPRSQQLALGPPQRRQVGTTSRAEPARLQAGTVTAIQLRHLPRVRGTDDQVEWHPPRIRQSKSRSASSTRRRDSSSRVTVAGTGSLLGRRRQTSTSPTATPMPARPTASGTSQANSPDPLGRRGRQDPLAELRDQGVLDLLLRPAGLALLVDEVADLVGGRRVRQVEPRAADRAHHLGLDLVLRELRRGGHRDRHGDEQQQHRQRQQPPHAWSALAIAARSPSASICAREPLDGAALAVDHERLGEAGDAEAVLLLALAVVRLRVVEAEALREGAGVVDHVVRVDADEHHAVLLLLGRHGGEQRRLVLARVAPRGPEVDDHDLALVVGQAHAVGARQCRQVERRRRRQPAGRDALHERVLRPRVLDRHHEHHDQSEHGRDAEGLQQALQAAARRS